MGSNEGGDDGRPALIGEAFSGSVAPSAEIELTKRRQYRGPKDMSGPPRLPTFCPHLSENHCDDGDSEDTKSPGISRF